MAFTESEKFHRVIGDRKLVVYQLTGDGSDTAWTAPLGTIDVAWIQEYTSGATGTSIPGITWSTNVVTFGLAPASGMLVMVFCIGV